MTASGRVWPHVAERVAGGLLVGWLQVVGVVTHSVVHHILHALPLVVLLVVRSSPARSVTALLAGYLWVFMLAAVTPMLHNALILGWVVSRPQLAYTWLAPVAAGLAVVWAAANAWLLRPSRWTLPVGVLVGTGLTLGLAAVHPYISTAFEYPLERTFAGEYWWAAVLLLETAVVLAVPAWGAFRLGQLPRPTWRFAVWQVAFWVFFVAMMVAGLLPAFNRD